MHAAVHAELGIDATYEALAVPPEDLAAVVLQLAADGWTGINVTVPHKVAVLAACDDLTDEARLVGAVNTIHFRESGTLGDNTDARGWLASLHAESDWQPRQAAVVLGTGGAARAVVVALGRDAAEVVVVGRDGSRARELAHLAVAAGAARGVGVSLGQTGRVESAIRDARLLVNATPLGMAGEPLPEPFLGLRRSQIAADLVYEPAMTPFLQAAVDVGATAVGGMGMLVHQAALAFARWHDVAPPVDAFWRAAGREPPA